MERSEITQYYIKSILEYNGGLLYWRVKIARKVKIGKVAGGIKRDKKTARYEIRLFGKLYKAARLIFLWHHGWLPEEIDHEDHDPLNNLISNLRPASHQQNSQNTSSRKNVTSKYLGVSLTSKSHKHTLKSGDIKNYIHTYWQSQLSVNGKHNHLGYFKTEEAAALAYNEAAKIHFKEFAHLNIITA